MVNRAVAAVLGIPSISFLAYYDANMVSEYGARRTAEHLEMVNRAVAAVLGILSISLLAGYGANMVSEYGTQRTAERIKWKADRAVSVLPPGVEHAWDAWIDKEVAEKITRSGSVIRLDASIITGPSTAPLSLGLIYVSATNPFQVQCSTGITVSFVRSPTHSNTDEASVTIGVPWIGWPAATDSEVTTFFWYSKSEKGMPTLGVPGNSIAAEQLARRLCARAASDVAKVMY